MAFSVGSVTGITAKTGVGGLISGMDIDSIIEKMTTASRDRITKQEQSVQKLMWKQDAYRSVTKSLMEFRSKYLDSLSSTNFKSQSFFNTVQASIASSVTAFTATATGTAAAGEMYVNKVEQLATSYKLTSKSSVSGSLQGQEFDAQALIDSFGIDDIKAGTLTRAVNVSLDGQTRMVVLDKAFFELADRKSSDYTVEGGLKNIEAALQDRLDSLFGANQITADINFDSGTGMASLNLDTVNPSSKLTVEGGITSTESQDTTLGLLGLSAGQSNKISLTSSIASLGLDGLVEPTNADGNFSFTINGQYFSINKNQTLQNLMDMINNPETNILTSTGTGTGVTTTNNAGVKLSYSEITDTFTLTAKSTGASGEPVISDISPASGNLLQALGISIADVYDASTNAAGKTEYTAGQNAKAYINGSLVERSTNTFTVDGVTISLKETYAGTANVGDSGFATSGEKITLATNPDDLFDAIKGFVEDYNTMLGFMRGLVGEEADEDYEPLTEAQKAEMSEAQIKQWEDKAKTGILQNDALVNRIANTMQTTLFGTSSGGFGLYSMGIKTGSYLDKGKLTIDEDKLREALAQRPDDVKNLFTNATTGISAKLDKVLDDAVRTNAKTNVLTTADGISILDKNGQPIVTESGRGSLIQIAGYESTRSDTDNTITSQINSYLKRIDNYKEQLTKEETRLWNKFSAMETALAQLSEQSSVLSQYLGTSTS
ncbi:MAG: flagellar filament capping protein FliD [Clostridiales Family XIII bacterium]|jgi:flagellar hook-associated protein 2|nr:flagellar filament capping protein FliD [Clostridiales Family XIII bacterium]